MTTAYKLTHMLVGALSLATLLYAVYLMVFDFDNFAHLIISLLLHAILHRTFKEMDNAKL